MFAQHWEVATGWSSVAPGLPAPGSTALKGDPRSQYTLRHFCLMGLWKKTLTFFLDGFLLYSLFFCVLSIVYFFSAAYIPQQSFSGNIGILMWLHSVNGYNEYKTNSKKQHVFHIPYMIKHFMYYRWKTNYRKGPCTFTPKHTYSQL